MQIGLLLTEVNKQVWIQQNFFASQVKNRLKSITDSVIKTME